MFCVNLNEIESIEYRKALNVYHYIITHNEDFRTLHKVVEPNTLIKPKVIDFSRITKFGYRLVKLSNGYYTYDYKEYGKYKISNLRFDFATDINDLGLAVVCKDGKITWLNTKFKYLNPKTEEFIPLTKNNFDGYCYLSNLNKEKIGSVKKEYYDDETELDVGYAAHKEAVRSLRRK